MGLLDDAIREHLELKRLRGADPSAVAREEQDALGPVRRQDQVDRDSHMQDDSSVSPNTDGRLPASSEQASVANGAEGGQETVEINMEAELAAGADTAPAPDEAPAGPAAYPAHARTVSDESLEWEVPGGRDDSQVHDTGQEDLEGHSAHSVHDDQAEPVEDVLEEIPDFLRDTPEQERLWFEQRPPRDFDFNE